tara:strand:- start:1663 stop:2352 length:690 start_codon:yes stop_codon:yes gene_type:complete
MTIFGVIPARGGSKGIPHKNIVNLNGKPLISYSIESAKESKLIDEFIVSTDDKEIAKVANSYGASVPFIRPDSISGDSSKMIDVLIHSYNWIKKKKVVEGIILLQPTSPFRKSKHIDEAIQIYKDNSANTVVSLVEVPHQYNPYSLNQIDERGLVKPFLDKVPLISLRQEKPKFYARNGPSILILRPNQLKTGSLYGKKCMPYFMSLKDSLDIDSYEDLLMAEKLFSKN